MWEIVRPHDPILHGEEAVSDLNKATLFTLADSIHDYVSRLISNVVYKLQSGSMCIITPHTFSFTAFPLIDINLFHWGQVDNEKEIENGWILIQFTDLSVFPTCFNILTLEVTTICEVLLILKSFLSYDYIVLFFLNKQIHKLCNTILFYVTIPVREKNIYKLICSSLWAPKKGIFKV